MKEREEKLVEKLLEIVVGGLYWWKWEMKVASGP